MLPYTTTDEFCHRVQDTVITLNGQPIYIANINGNCMLHYYELPMQGSNTIKIISGFDPTLSAHDYRLGYCNLDHPYKCTYLTRMPARQTRQGLHLGNLFVPPESGANWGRCIGQKGFVEMLQSKYPSFAEAVDILVAGERQMLAFGRRLALEYDKLEMFILHYRGRKVASGLTPGIFRLPSHATYLREILQEQGLKVA